MQNEQTPPRAADKQDPLVGRWIPIAESTPTPHEIVLFVADGSVYYGHKESANPDSLMWQDHAQRDRDGDFDDVWNVTHWMPIPRPPNTAVTGSEARP